LVVHVSHRLPVLADDRRPFWLQLNLFTAIALGIGGFFLGAYVGGQIAEGKDYLIGTDQNDVGVFMGFLFATIGWFAGLGFFNYPLARLAGRPALSSGRDGIFVVPDATMREHEGTGVGRYFRLCTDHKVVGIQY